MLTLPIAVGLACAALLLAMPNAFGQSPACDEFNPVVGTDSPSGYTSVSCLAVQADGKVLLGGRFTKLGGQPRNCIGRLNPDGTLDAGFNPGADNEVTSLAVQADGKILVGGWFTMLGGQPRRRMGRLNPDGTLDTGFDPGAAGLGYDPFSYVSCMALQADGRILVGGSFTSLRSQKRERIGLLNPDGTLDEGFNPGANDTVYALAMQTDGKILVGGKFTTLGGQTRERIGRLNPHGTLDEGFNPGGNDNVYALALQMDGKILVGGKFTTLGGQTRERIGRLNLDGTLDTGFNPGAAVPYDPFPYVSCLALQTDGKILVGGSFTWLGGQTRERIGRLNPDGTLDLSFNPGANGLVQCLALQADGKPLVGGGFAMLGGQTRTSIGRLNATAPAKHSLTYDGSTITWSRSGNSPEVWRTVLDWSSDGLLWTPVGEGALVPGGWTMTNSVVPAQATLRARGFVAGDKSSWFVEDYWGPLVWIAQPVNRTNDAGSFVSFGGLVGGTAPAYQWFKDEIAVIDGAHISGSTKEWLTLTDVVGADAGGYHVVISNAYGVRTSVVATLTVNDPTITVPPVSQNREPGESVTLSVTARGTAPLEYQWWKDGMALSGQTKPLMTLSDLRFPDGGAYCVVVSSPYGSVTSSVASVRVNILDTGFDLQAGRAVNSLAVQADGKILVGGDFSSLRGSFGDIYWEPRHRIGRVNPDGTLDTGFDPGAEDGSYPSVPSVNALALQADGKILVGGWFTTLGGQWRHHIGRLNLDGTLDTGFNPGADNSVSSLLVQADGKILVGGRFTALGGKTRNCIGRLNPAGTLDTGFNPGAGGGYEPSVSALAVQADGKILVGGKFTELGGQARNCIGRLNADGTLDTGFNPGAGGDHRFSVYSLALQADGKILVGGHFTTLAGQARNYIGRLNPDGTLDTGFDPGANNDVYSLALQADGRILVGGDFTTLGGQPRERIGRLNPDGTLDTGLNPGVNGSVSCLAVQADGKILVGGGFDTLDGQSRSRIGRLSATDPATQNLTYDGSTVTWLRGGTSPEVWRTTFDCSTNGVDWMSLGIVTRIPEGWQLNQGVVPTQSTIRARGFVAGGIYNGSGWFVEDYWGAPGWVAQPVSQTNAAGSAATFGGAAKGTPPLSYQWFKNGVAINDGAHTAGATTAWIALTDVLGADAGDYQLVVSNVYGSRTSVVATLSVNDPAITGEPSSQNEERGANATLTVAARGTAPLDYLWWKDGVRLAGRTGPSITLTNLEVADAGAYQVVVGSTYGRATSRVARVTVNSATLDTGFYPGANSFVLSLALQADGKILAGGAFSSLGGQFRNYIARLNPGGTLDAGFNPGVIGHFISSLVVQADGRILVGGEFTSLCGQTRKHIGRLNPDGTLDTGFNPGAEGGYQALVYSLAAQADGKVLVAGSFTTLGGQTRNCIGRLNPDGTLDTGFNPGANDYVSSLALQADGKILVGGNFTMLAEQPRSYFARLNPDGTLDTGFKPGAIGVVYSMVVQADGKILVGGTFTILGEQPRSYLARLNPDGTLDTGFNPEAGGGSVNSLAVQADGKILVGGEFTTLGGQTRKYIARLNPDGTLDAGFTPEADKYLYSLVLQADGEVLAGGLFATLNRQPRSYIGRLNATDPATQSLTYDGSTVTWLRGGTSPEVWRTTFDCSTNGVDWTSLGVGTRIAGGWQLNQGIVPPQATIRARGFVAGGIYNGSGWVVESLLTIGAPTVAPMLSVESMNGPSLWFKVTGGTSAQYAVETATNLPSAEESWQPVTTLTLTNGWGLFGWTNTGESGRFFRAK